MKSAMRYLLLAIFTISCCLSGCASKSDEPDLDSLTSESLLGEDTQYAYLNQVLGGMSSRDMFDMVDNMMSNMNAAVRAGDASAEDYSNLVRVLNNIVDWMDSTKPKTAAEEAAGSPGLAMLDMMVENNVGDIMTRAVRTAGPDILTAHVFPMMAYVMACDKQIVDDAVNGITINDLGFDTSKLTRQNFSAMVNAAHGFLDEDNADYKAIRDAWDALDAKIDQRGLDVTVGDVKDMLPDMDLEDMDNLPLYIDTFSALHKLYDEDPKIKEDLDKMMYALGHLMKTNKASDGHNAWDTRSMSDMERLLYCLGDVLKPEGRGKLSAFMLRVLNAIDGLDGADNIYGATSALSRIYNMRDPYTNTIPDLNEIDYALYRAMFQMNQDFEPTETGTVKFSEMRTIMLIFDVMCILSDTLSGDPTEAILSLIDIEDGEKGEAGGPVISTRSDILQFVVNLWGQSCYSYPKSFHGSYTIDSAAEYRPYPDPLQGTDWLWFNEDIRYMGLPTPGLSWLLNFVTNFALTDYVMGIMTESMNSLVTFTGSNNKKFTSGHYHRMLSLAGPLIQYYGDINYGSQLIHVIGAMNEVELSSYMPMSIWLNKGTLRQANTGTAFETIEGPYGYGLIYYLMRGASGERYNHDADIADPALDLLVRVLYKLNTTPYEDSNLLRHLCDLLTSHDFNPDDKTNQELIDDLFEDDGFIDNLYTFISANHEPLAQVCATLGDVIMTATDQTDKQKDIFYSDDVAALVQTGVLPKLGAGLKGNRTAVWNLVNNTLNQADVHTEVSAAAADLAATVCDKAELITSDLAAAVPGLDEIIDASTVDYDYVSADSKLQPFIDYLVDDVNGKENPLIFNLKALGYKVMGIYDATYNPSAGALKYDDNTPVMDVVNHVMGDTGIYDTAPLTNFLFDLTGDNGDVLWRLIDADETYNPLDLHWLEKIFGDDLDDMLSWEFIRSMCLSYNGQDPVMLMVFKTIHLDHNGQAIEFGGVMNDMSTFFHNQEFQPGTRLFDGIFDALKVVVNCWG